MIQYIEIPNHPDPTNPGATITAHGRVTFQQLGDDGYGRCVVTIHRSAAAYAAGAMALERREFDTGDGVMPTRDQMLADNAFATAYLTVANKLTTWAAAGFAGATVRT